MSLQSITARTNTIMAAINQVRMDSGEKPLIDSTKQWNDTWCVIFHNVEIAENATKQEAIRAISEL